MLQVSQSHRWERSLKMRGLLSVAGAAGVTWLAGPRRSQVHIPVTLDRYTAPRAHDLHCVIQI